MSDFRSFKSVKSEAVDSEKRAERLGAKLDSENEKFPFSVHPAGNGKAHWQPSSPSRSGGIRPMVYILKGKVSWLRLLASIWTAFRMRPCRPAAKPRLPAAGEMLKL
jgi:hypothetical protein